MIIVLSCLVGQRKMDLEDVIEEEYDKRDDKKQARLKLRNRVRN